MSIASIANCDVCGGGWARRGKGWACPEGCMHNVCGMCLWKWGLITRGHKPGRPLKSCPAADEFRLMRELMGTYT